MVLLVLVSFQPTRALCFLICLLYLLLFQSLQTRADKLKFPPLMANCTGDSYIQNSTFATNLANLLESLTLMSTTSNSNTFTSGTNPGPDPVYGLYMCQGDLGGSDCQNCINSAASNITNLCPKARRATIWYDLCELRYSDQDFFGIIGTNGFNLTSPYGNPNSAEPLAVAAQLLESAPLKRPLMFASMASADGSVYAIAQCTIDLSPDECRDCLMAIFDILKSCCSDKKGWRFMAASCWIRYEPTNFLFSLNDMVTPVKTTCSGESYSQNSTFATSLVALFASLTFKSLLSNSDGATEGSSPDIAYGLFMCQGDLPSSSCWICVRSATTVIAITCPAARHAVIWYDYCLLRYSDKNIMGDPDTNGYNFTNPVESTNSTEPLEAMTDLVATAPHQRPLMFASMAPLAASDGVYGMAQCTADLSTSGCGRCLTTIVTDIRACCSTRKGWRYITPSCWIRYEPTNFLWDLNGKYTQIIDSNCETEAKLDNLLTDLTAEAQSTGFYNATTGDSTEKLYSLALCRGDLQTPGDQCSKCLSNARRTILEHCNNKPDGINWYDKCLLRYSNKNFFGVVDFNGQTLCSEEEQVNEEAADATTKLAASYILVQCTRDLSSNGCLNCLEKGTSDVARKCNQTNGWRYFSGSCMMRYQTYPFFNMSVIQEMPTPQPKPADHKIGEGKSSKKIVVAITFVSILVVIVLGLLFYYTRWKVKRRNNRRESQVDVLRAQASVDLPLMDFSVIQAATNNFSDENKLGEGGYGPVYKAVLPGGQEVAVKRLSIKSKQGAVEFKNEVKLIAKLQHRNLVRILGCCADRDEKLLVYEYLPKRSLDAFLFDANKRSQLDWNSRFHIISGIARGLLYLHEDSLLKVIHRDLKASNVLLDNNMNPKIADFGMAKIYETDESEVNASRVVGTYGYMAPEYAMDGHYSVKSDVYSFGVLLLEIVSGVKNSGSHFEIYGQTLPRRAWQLLNEDKALELMDPLLGDSYQTSEVMKCIQIGLLCVQGNAGLRPTMASVIHMLMDELPVIHQPSEPATFAREMVEGIDLLTTRTHSTTPSSCNDVTNSSLQPR